MKLYLVSLLVMFISIPSWAMSQKKVSPPKSPSESKAPIYDLQGEKLYFYLSLFQKATPHNILTLSEGFEIEEGSVLDSQVRFWLNLFSSIPSTQGLVIDAMIPPVVLEHVLSVSRHETHPQSKNQIKASWRQAVLGKWLEEQQRALCPLLPFFSSLKLDSDPQKVQTLETLFSANHPPFFWINLLHRKRIRFQQGSQEFFEQSLKESSYFLPRMEAIFQEHQVPLLLTRIPFVESSFSSKALSQVGAGGIWQFLKATAQRYLKISPIIDQRRDPWAATHAAARLLRQNYEILKNWPLAVTAYNHGVKGILRGMLKTGATQFSEFLNTYQDRSFGFASQNYLAEILAAFIIEQHPEAFFPNFKKEASEKLVKVQPQMKEISWPQPMSWRALQKQLKIPLPQQQNFSKLNPAILPLFFKSGTLPESFVIQVMPEWLLKRE